MLWNSWSNLCPDEHNNPIYVMGWDGIGGAVGVGVGVWEEESEIHAMHLKYYAPNISLSNIYRLVVFFPQNDKFKFFFKKKFILLF